VKNVYLSSIKVGGVTREKGHYQIIPDVSGRSTLYKTAKTDIGLVYLNVFFSALESRQLNPGR
jgi:hypothetical protein